MISLNDCEKEKGFIKYIFDKNNENKLEEIGAKPLSDEEK
jgi:hypothetical protein